MKKIGIPILILVILSTIFLSTRPSTVKDNFLPINRSTPIPKETLPPYPSAKSLKNDYHIFQTFNNCGPASLSMALSYYDINVTQKVLGDSLRPYQIASGDNDDKSVTLSELSEKSKDYGLIPFHRPNGNMEIVKNLINHDMPVIVRTTTKQSEDIGHFRVIKGYDDTTSEIIQDDSLQGKNLRYSYADFDILWQKFNYEYLVLVPAEKIKSVELILGNDIDERYSWEQAALNSKSKLDKNPNDIFDRFNLSVAYYKLGNYQQSIEEFEKVENSLPMRTLWYQIEPILSYYKVNNYSKVIELTDKILNSGNRSFSELYIVRSKVYKAQGDNAKSESELQKARLYNKNIDFEF